MICVTLFAIYVVVYRFILYRLPILYTWKEQPQEVPVAETVKGSAPVRTSPSTANAVYRSTND